MKFGNPAFMKDDQINEVREELRDLFVSCVDLETTDFDVRYDEEMGEWYYETEETTYYRSATNWDPEESSGRTYEVRFNGLYFSRKWKCLLLRDVAITETEGW
jgi:hypothetical protein